jgi:hypothetical protein
LTYQSQLDDLDGQNPGYAFVTDSDMSWADRKKKVTRAQKILSSLGFYEDGLSRGKNGEFP